jgi:hypothetical protein
VTLPHRIARRFKARRRSWSSFRAADGMPMMHASVHSARGLVIPDSTKRLSEGVVVETSLLARVLGIKLLRVQGMVLISPARLEESNGIAPESSEAEPSSAAESHSAGSSQPDRVLGTQLRLTAHVLDENADQLRELSRASDLAF